MEKINLNIYAGKWRSLCLGLNMLSKQSTYPWAPNIPLVIQDQSS